MSLKLEGSGSTEISQVYPFNLPDTQNSIENAMYEFYDTTTSLSDAATAAQRNIRWEVSGSNHMTDLKNSYILMRVKLSKAGGGNYALSGANNAVVPDADQVSLCAGWSQLLIDRFNLYLNGVNLSEGDSYGYKGWIASILEEEEGSATEPIHTIRNETNFNMTPVQTFSAFKNGSKEDEGWVLDNVGQVEVNGFTANPARRYTHREYVAHPDGFTIIIRPKETMFLQSEFLVPQVKLKLEILTAVPKFWCQGIAAATAPELSISSARLFLKRIQLTPNAERNLLTTLSQTPAKYLFPRMRFTNQVIGTNQSRQVVSLLPGPRPNRVIVFFTKTSASDPAVGNLEQSPVAFSEFHNGANFVSRIYINVAGRQFPAKELEATHKNDIHRAYEMYKLSCSDYRKPLLSLKQFNDNHTIYCFNTTKSLMNDDEGVLHSGAMTDIQVNVLFSAKPAADVSMNVIAIDDGVVELDASGTVSKNY